MNILHVQPFQHQSCQVRKTRKLFPREMGEGLCFGARQPPALVRSEANRYKQIDDVLTSQDLDTPCGARLTRCKQGWCWRFNFSLFNTYTGKNRPICCTIASPVSSEHRLRLHTALLCATQGPISLFMVLVLCYLFWKRATNS